MNKDVEGVKEWLKTHDAVSITWIERKLGLTHGSLRLDTLGRKHIQKIKYVLMEYGYDPNESPKEEKDERMSFINTISIWERRCIRAESENRRYKKKEQQSQEAERQVKTGELVLSGEEYVTRESIVGVFDEEGLFKRANLPNGSRLMLLREK